MKQRDIKQEKISALRNKLDGCQLAVIVEYKGLTVKDMTRFRKQANDNGVEVNVAKNSLARLAVDGTNFEGLKSVLRGQTAIISSQDPIAAAKTVAAFAKENEKMVILGGVLDKEVLDVKAVNNLATMPSLDELRGKIIGLLTAPAQQLVGISQAPAAQLARVINAFALKSN